MVYDAKTNEDITRSVLTQIIFEEESRGQNLLPIQFLRQLIRFYGDRCRPSCRAIWSCRSTASPASRSGCASQFADARARAGIGVFEEQVRQNLALFDRAMKMFSPVRLPRRRGRAAAPPPPKPPPSRPATSSPS